MPGYETDYYGWLEGTARAVEEGRWNEVDAAQLAEELRDLGKSERRGIVSHIQRVLTHVLKIRYQRGRHSRSWDLSIAESRVQLRRLLAESPSLQSRLEELIVEAYETARIQAARETIIALDVFPEQCPYSAEDVLERDWASPDSTLGA